MDNKTNPLEYYKMTQRYRLLYWHRIVDFFRYNFHLNKRTCRPYPSYYVPSSRKSTLIQKLLVQIPKAFHQHRIVGTTKMIFGINDII